MKPRLAQSNGPRYPAPDLSDSRADQAVLAPRSKSKARPGLLTDDFSRAFSKILEENHVSCYAITQFTGLNEGYLSRLKSGEKHNPSLETLLKISLALAHLGVPFHDIEQLLNSVGRTMRIRS